MRRVWEGRHQVLFLQYVDVRFLQLFRPNGLQRFARFVDTEPCQFHGRVLVEVDLHPIGFAVGVPTDEAGEIRSRSLQFRNRQVQGVLPWS